MALHPLITGQCSNIMQKARQVVGLAWWADECSSFPRLVPPDATLHPRGNKSSQSAETGFWGFAFMGGKWFKGWVVFTVTAWVLNGSQLQQGEALHCWSGSFVVLLCLYFFHLHTQRADLRPASLVQGRMSFENGRLVILWRVDRDSGKPVKWNRRTWLKQN